MSTAIDTSLVREIGQDQLKVALRLLWRLLLVGVGVWLIVGDFSGIPRSGLNHVYGWIGAVYFAVDGAFVVRRLLKPVAPFTLSPEGLLMPDVSGELIPWPWVLEVREKIVRGIRRFVEIRLETWAQPMLKPTVGARYRNFGSPLRTLTVGAQIASITHDDLLKMIVAYARAHSNGVPSTATTAATSPSSSRVARQS